MASKYFDVDATKRFFDISTWLTAIAGSVVLLLIYQAITSGSFRPSRRRRAPDDGFTQRTTTPNLAARITHTRGHQVHD